jgi:Sodium/calcium exchanger protein
MTTGTGNDITEEANTHQPLLGPTSSSESMFRPNRIREDYRTLLCSAYINVLLIFVPFALVSGALEWSARTVFLTNLLALMPLASLLSVATDVLSESAGNAVGCLLNVTFGNATELIVGIVSLRKGQVKLIQTTMLGSILSSLLFVRPPLRDTSYQIDTWIDVYNCGNSKN